MLVFDAIPRPSSVISESALHGVEVLHFSDRCFSSRVDGALHRLVSTRWMPFVSASMINLTSSFALSLMSDNLL